MCFYLLCRLHMNAYDATFYYCHGICLYVPSNITVWITLKLGRRVYSRTENKNSVHEHTVMETDIINATINIRHNLCNWMRF